MDPTVLAACNPDGRWRALRAIGMVRAERTLGGKTSVEERYFISVMQHLALNLLKKEPSKQSIRVKRQKAGWDEEFLAKLLVG